MNWPGVAPAPSVSQGVLLFHWIGDLLALIGRHGRWMLLLGLGAGLLLPSVASTMRPWLTPLIALILLVSMLRILPERVLSAFSHFRRDIPALFILQFLLPLAVAAVTRAAGIERSLADGLILMAAAAPMASGPAIALMLGLDGLTALRLLVWGTLLLPISSIPAFQIVFAGESVSVVEPALRLAAIIFLAGGLAFVIRRFIMKKRVVRTVQVLDGVSAILMAAFVLALMDAIQPMLLEDPRQVATTLVAAFIASFGLQLLTYSFRWPHPGMPEGADRSIRGAVAVIAGARNMGLFLAALPPAYMDSVMVFVGCYQIPVFMTPLLMAHYYRPDRV